jgi:dihydrofolate reductase
MLEIKDTTMKKLIFFMHITLDGYVAGPKGEMDWINLPDSLFDFVGTLTAEADVALYGRKTYQMMQSYWPTAGEKPNATKHDKEHSEWYNQVKKIVLSKSKEGIESKNTTLISENLSENINNIKNQAGKNILVFGSPTAVQSLLKENLIDEFWLSVNPILLGAGRTLFENLTSIMKLKFLDSKNFPGGIVLLHYGKGEII